MQLWAEWVEYGKKNIPVKILCCKGDERNPWNLGALQKSGDELAYPLLVGELNRVFGHIATEEIFAPQASEFDTKLLGNGHSLRHKIPLGSERTLYRDSDAPAEGVFLEPGEAFAVRAAGCAIVVMQGVDLEGKTHCLAMHAGRWSLLDQKRIETDNGEKSRLLPSVVYNAVGCFGKREVYKPSFVGVYCAIRPEDFGHGDPRMHEFNERMHDYIHKYYGKEGAYWKDNVLHIDLPKIIQAQLKPFGYPVDLTNAYLPRDWPHTRNRPPGGPSNLIIVARPTTP